MIPPQQSIGSATTGSPNHVARQLESRCAQHCSTPINFCHVWPLWPENTSVFCPERPSSMGLQHLKSAKIAPFCLILPSLEPHQTKLQTDGFWSYFDPVNQPCPEGPSPRTAQSGAQGVAMGQNPGFRGVCLGPSEGSKPPKVGFGSLEKCLRHCGLSHVAQDRAKSG